MAELCTMVLACCMGYDGLAAVTNNPQPMAQLSRCLCPSCITESCKWSKGSHHIAPIVSMAFEFSSGSSALSQQIEERENWSTAQEDFGGLGLKVVTTGHLSELSHIAST